MTTELERAADRILDLWDFRTITVTNALDIPEVTNAFIDFRNALRDLRIERLNHKEIA